MLTLRGIITLIVLVILFALAVVWISKQGASSQKAVPAVCPAYGNGIST